MLPLANLLTSARRRLSMREEKGIAMRRIFCCISAVALASMAGCEARPMPQPTYQTTQPVQPVAMAQPAPIKTPVARIAPEPGLVVTVREHSAKFVQFKQAFETKTATIGPYYVVYVVLENKSQTRKLDYFGSKSSRLMAKPTLYDEFGNKYKIYEGFGPEYVVGQRGDESVYPGQECHDLYCFETPVKLASKLTFTMPGERFSSGENAVVSLDIAVAPKK